MFLLTLNSSTKLMGLLKAIKKSRIQSKKNLRISKLKNRLHTEHGGNLERLSSGRLMDSYICEKGVSITSFREVFVNNACLVSEALYLLKRLVPFGR